MGNHPLAPLKTFLRHSPLGRRRNCISAGTSVLFIRGDSCNLWWRWWRLCVTAGPGYLGNIQMSPGASSLRMKRYLITNPYCCLRLLTAVSRTITRLKPCDRAVRINGGGKTLIEFRTLRHFQESSYEL